jgi:N utilization substance protein B
MQFLFQLDYNEDSSPESLSYFWTQLENSKAYPVNNTFRRAAVFAEEIIHKTLKEKKIIDNTIERFASNWKLERMGAVDRNVMRIAVAEMLFFPDIPPIVSINEAVETAKNFGSESSGGFVNGILNSVKNSLDRDPRKKQADKK